ncbi:unnamed protein product [Rhizoctonia solani]|uniref:Methyltransferase domain-containing protein n=1 Tax=Rhizoctonia solani TaxID=456999 RepID=A0A8H3BSX4_9AGAM|nr:unnamed protein product [Rhizoctonia solani]
MSQTAAHSHVNTGNVAGHHVHSRPAPGGFKEANRQWFDSKAHSHEGGYEAEPAAVEMARKASETYLKAFPFDKNQTVVLDFASGTGMISQNLSPHSKKIIGVDISSKSVEFYNERFATKGVSPEEVKSICFDITERSRVEKDPLDGIEFDVIVCSGAYHHLDDINETTKALASYLKPGTGTLVITDFIASPEAASLLSHHEHVVVNASGFTEELIRSAFVDAGGLQEFSFKPAFQLSWNEKTADLFVAKAVRPSL